MCFSEDDEQISTVATYSHKHEVSNLSFSNTNPSLFATVYNTVDSTHASIWKFPENRSFLSTSGNTNAPEPPVSELDLVGEIPFESEENVSCLQWLPSGGQTIICATSSGIREVFVREGGGAAASKPYVIDTSSSQLKFGDDRASFIGSIACDPHHASEVSVAFDSSIISFDLRSRERIRNIERADSPGSKTVSGCVRSLSFNPNKPWVLASGGDDHRVHFWDVRKANAPVKTLSGHSHWVTAVSFNPFHDQLILSGGTDAQVNLWRISSISSAPLLELAEDLTENEDDSSSNVTTPSLISETRRSEPKLAADIAIRVQTDHSDSITALTWSARTAWVYASMSSDGKVVVSQVPSAEKYKVLL